VSVKYRVIERLRNVYPVVALCRILEVSRSGYYNWRYRIYGSHADAWLEQQILPVRSKHISHTAIVASANGFENIRGFT